MPNPNPPRPPSISDIGLQNHIGDELYSEVVKLFKADASNAAIARYLKENGFTDELKDDRTIAKWRNVWKGESNV